MCSLCRVFTFRSSTPGTVGRGWVCFVQYIGLPSKCIYGLLFSFPLECTSFLKALFLFSLLFLCANNNLKNCPCQHLFLKISKQTVNFCDNVLELREFSENSFRKRRPKCPKPLNFKGILRFSHPLKRFTFRAINGIL